MHIHSGASRFALPILVSLALILATGCGGGGKDRSGDPPVVGGATEIVVMKGTAYSPGNLQVPVGAVVTFRNEDAAQHDAKAKDGSWETDDLGKGDSDDVVLETVGEFTYFCEFHPSMKAKITVVDGGDASDPR